MRFSSTIYLLMFALTASISSCTKDPGIVPEGTVRLLINVNHHGFSIANAVVFRKNGTLIFPGTDTALYDSRYVTDASGNLIISDVGNENKTMVLYAKGIDPTWDTLVITPVSGYQFVNVTTGIGESKDFAITIPVSE